MNPYIQIKAPEDWREGQFQNVVLEETGICLDHTLGKRGIYLGAIIDSGEKGHLWSRMVLEVEKRSETKLVVYTLALDQLSFMRNGTTYDLESIISRQTMALTELSAVLSTLQASRHEDQSHVLLQREEGRYFIYWIEFIAEGPSSLIKGLRIYYEKFSWISYLPQIYAENSSFLEPYLAIFQTVHEDIEEVIDHLPEVYMPEKTHTSFLDILEKWMPIEGSGSWNEIQRRYLLSHYESFNSHRGTSESVKQYAALFLGSEPLIVEHFQYKYLKESVYHRNLYNRLYNDSPYGFTLIVTHSCALDKKKYVALTELLTQCTPAQVNFKIASLKPYMVLDDYVYLGYNSILFNQSEMKLDDQSILSMGLVSRDNEKG